MSDIKKNIIEYLSKHGFALELEAERIFKKYGFETSPSFHYLDSEEEKYREIDLTINKQVIVGNFYFNMVFVLECKNTPERPWIVIKKSYDSDDTDLLRSFCGTRNTKIILDAFEEKYDRLNDLNKLILPNNQAEVGFNVVQFSASNNHNDAYAASMTLKKACDYLRDRANESDANFANLYIPIIVINAPLFSCSLNDNNELSVEESHSEIMVEIRAFETPVLRSYTIVTKEYLDEFARKLFIYVEQVQSELMDAIKKTAREKPNNTTKGKYNVR